MTADTFTKAQLVLHCWRLAAGVEERKMPTLELMKAFAFVQRNRVAAGWMGGDWLRVMARESVYGSREATAATNDLEYPDLGEPVGQKFLWEIDRIFDGSSPDKVTSGGLWWCELNKTDRPWFLENISRKPELHPRVAQVGNVTFFK